LAELGSDEQVVDRQPKVSSRGQSKHHLRSQGPVALADGRKTSAGRPLKQTGVARECWNGLDHPNPVSPAIQGTVRSVRLISL